MVVESNLLNALFFIICCVLPGCGFFVLVAIMFIRSVKARLIYAKELSEHLDDPIYLEKQLPVPRRYLSIYVAISWVIICSLMCVATITLAYYLNFSIKNIINANTLGFIATIVLLIALLTTLVMLIVMKVRSSKK